MHFVAVLYEKTARSFRRDPSRIDLRGYKAKTWVPAELARLELPVHALAYAPCPTCRDVYLERVAGVETPFTWERYKGKVVDFIYKRVHEICAEYMTQCSAQTCNLLDELIGKQDELVEEAKNKFATDYGRIENPPAAKEAVGFYDSLKKIIRFEGELTSATINFEIARNRSASPKRVFYEHFDFNTDYSLIPCHQGFSSPATPDFIFKHKVIGDIKTGSWKEFFEFTAIAYALAYEDHTGQNMDYGVILNVDLPTRRLVPVHYKVGIQYLDDYRRKRFIAVRDRKLQILHRKTDPGKPAREKCPSDCPFLGHCWNGGG
jgi:CRISPR-associated protein Cas4/Csa1 subtype I-A